MYKLGSLWYELFDNTIPNNGISYNQVDSISTTSTKILNQNHIEDIIISNREVKIRIQKIDSVEKFYAHFPICIWTLEYYILVSWETSILKNLTVSFPDRQHPFDKKISNASYSLDCLRWDIIRSDIIPEMNMILIKDCKNISTDNNFWKLLRNRIPSNHPLSLIPQH